MKICFFLFIFLVLLWVFLFVFNNFISDNTKIFELQKSLEFPKEFENFKIVIDGVEYAQSLPLNLKTSIDFEHLNHFSRVPTILLWTPFWRSNDFGFGLGYKQPFIRNGCPVFNCEITNDKTKYNKSDLIVFHARMNFSFPHYRLRDQRWIFTEFESPIYSPNYTKFNNIFNFTYTYRVESEFSRILSSGYRMFEYGRNFSFDENKDFSKGKTGFAAAVISNCISNSGRDIFINKLKQFIPVSIYGKCGKNCTDKFKALSKCKRLIGKKYKFYLSFENSICNGYITEKFFEILRYDIIPVVLGGGQYTKFVPKSGFINVFDYKNPQELGHYLKYLDQNKTAYNSYFKWKKYVLFKPRYQSSNLCDMCLMLNLENEMPIRRNIVRNIGKFWSKQNCKKLSFDKNDTYYLEN